MKIINSYDEIDRKSLKVGDSFLLLHDKDNFSSYQFEEKDDTGNSKFFEIKCTSAKERDLLANNT